VDAENRNLELAARNIPNVCVLRAENLNVYDIIKHNWLVMSKQAAQAVEARLLPGASALSKAPKGAKAEKPAKTTAKSKAAPKAAKAKR
jgi:hypothetical protein